MTTLVPPFQIMLAPHSPYITLDDVFMSRIRAWKESRATKSHKIVACRHPLTLKIFPCVCFIFLFRTVFWSVIGSAKGNFLPEYSNKKIFMKKMISKHDLTLTQLYWSMKGKSDLSSSFLKVFLLFRKLGHRQSSKRIFTDSCLCTIIVFSVELGRVGGDTITSKAPIEFYILRSIIL